jgi:hypothetical protein
LVPCAVCAVSILWLICALSAVLLPYPMAGRPPFLRVLDVALELIVRS